MPTLSLDDVELHYDQHGVGQPVVFIHGGVLNGAMTWSEQLPLAKRWRVVVVDRPGFGTSSPVERVDFALDAERVVEILDRAKELWDVDRIHLVGTFLRWRDLPPGGRRPTQRLDVAHRDRTTRVRGRRREQRRR